jgi:hypothetical protein
MATAKTPIEIDQEALAVAAEVLGTTTKKDTVNAALREVGQKPRPRTGKCSMVTAASGSGGFDMRRLLGELLSVQ